MNGSQGITPTIELATANNGNGFAYPYPVYPMMGGFGGNSGFGGYGDGSWIWVILLLALFGWGNNGNSNGGFFGGNSFDDGYAWLSNGQKDIMNQTSDGFNSLHLSNQIEGIRDDVNDIQNAICNSTASINSNISNGFYNAEISANNRQMADMQQNYNNQLSTLQSFNALERQLCDCCCDNKLAVQDLKATVISENCADREALSNGIRDIITNQTANTQKVLDVLCQNQITELRDKLADRDRELQTARFNASQIAQTADIRENNAVVASQLVNELRSCPIPAQPVYGNTPIFSCNGNNGCGCGNFTASQFI